MKKLKMPAHIQETLLHLLLAAVVTASVVSLPLDFLEAPLYDLRYRLSHKPVSDDRIALITIDDQTLNQINDINPLPLSYHLKAVEKLEEQQVKAVGYLMDFNKVQRIDQSGFEKDTAQELYRSTVRMNAQGIPFLLGVPFDVNGEVNAPFPLSQVPQAIAIVHRDGTTFGKDKVTRRGLISLNDRLAFEMALVNKVYPNESIQNPPGTYSSNEADAQYFLMQFHQNNNIVYDSNFESFSYPRYSFVDLIEGKIPAGELKDKIVLVGTFQRDNPNDFTLINSSQDSQLVPKILIHANILDSILNKQGIKQVQFPYLVLLSFLLSIAIIIASFKIRPSRLIQLTIYLLIGTFAISLLLFQPIPHIGSLWLPLGAPLISLTFSFYLMIPLRLYSEHRKRFALEKENKMLIEVEEMKTNFLQLVTHDLKTPIAKIQGLTESLKRSLGDRLSSKDLELMNHIFHANEDLNQFVNSILELSRIDNQGVRVHLQSKDINQLLEQVILKLRFVAQSKKIQITTDFEPLFAIKIDIELISKVLSNLIDNAIKYSAEGTTVHVHTREVGDSVEITVRDQGIGMSENDLSHLFARFYRIKNESTQKIKGSGLGLYLSKYFIEAHRGEISVTSEVGKGTEFKVLLPLELSETNLPQIGLTTMDPKILNKQKLISNNKENNHA
jgi:signal transduction histidine kinase